MPISILSQSHGFWGTGENGIYFKETGNKGQLLRGTGEQRHYWATENIRKQIFDFWGTSQFISGERGNRYHSPPPPPTPGRASIFMDIFHELRTNEKVGTCIKIQVARILSHSPVTHTATGINTITVGPDY